MVLSTVVVVISPSDAMPKWCSAYMGTQMSQIMTNSNWL